MWASFNSECEWGQALQKYGGQALQTYGGQALQKYGGQA
jgi:hypothetical protein